MNKIYSAVWSAVVAVAAVPAAYSQVVTTNPAVITKDTESVEITFHAAWGNQGLMNLDPSAKVYAHTGVITNLSTSASDWKYAPTWGTNTAKYEMTRTGDNLYTLKIPNLRSYYGITSSSETIERLAFVFRNANGSKEAKTVSYGDIFVTVFPSVFPACQQKPFPGGTPVMGATENADGTVTFCIAAPGKNDVLLVGSWNDYALVPGQQMNYTDVDNIRYFWTTVSGLEKGKDYIYYYLLDGQTAVGDPYAKLVVTPDDASIPATVFPDRPKYDAKKLPGVCAAVYNSAADDYTWRVKNFQGVDQSDLQIYELLLRDFTGTEGKANGNGTLAGAMEKLEYLHQLGVNAVELMPIMEFNGNQSWGYNTNFYMAPDKAYGSPREYREFIDRCHELGMAVILDIVFNQCDNQAPWWQMYPIQDNTFFNGSAPHAYSVLNDWHQGGFVQKHFCDVLKYWLTAYNVDGFRFDLVKGLGDNDSYGNTYDAATNKFGTPSDANTNAYNATRVARMKALHAAMKEVKPDAYFINENLATAKEENEMALDDEINWANVNNSACQYAMGFESQSSLSRFYAPADSRTWGSTVSYAVSHDEERPAYKQAKWGATGIKGNADMSCRRLGSLGAQMLMVPGAHMIWQFEEFGADQTTKNSSGNDTGNKTVVWSYLDKEPNKGIHQTYYEILNFRKNNPELFRQSATTNVSLSGFTTGRKVSMVAGDKAVYLYVNPAVATSMPISTGVDLTDTSRYRLVSVSQGVTPSLNSTAITLPAGAYAVYATTNTTGIDGVEYDGDASAAYAVNVVGNSIEVNGNYRSAAAYTADGVQVPLTNLGPGIYIVVVDGKATKLLVR